MTAVDTSKYYRKLTGADGRVYEARGTDCLSVCDRGLVWLHTKYVDVILNGKPTLYRHDGDGNLIMEGNLATVRVTLERGKTRFEHIEHWRQRAITPRGISDADACMSSLLQAVDEAEAWRKRQGSRTPQTERDRSREADKSFLRQPAGIAAE